MGYILSTPGRIEDRIESMSILVTAVEAGSLSAAARRLGAPLATVSRKVSELEAHLKTRLLTRSDKYAEHDLFRKTVSTFRDAALARLGQSVQRPRLHWITRARLATIALMFQ